MGSEEGAGSGTCGEADLGRKDQIQVGVPEVSTRCSALFGQQRAAKVLQPGKLTLKGCRRGDWRVGTHGTG